MATPARSAKLTGISDSKVDSLLVVVSGAPGTGKTTLAQRIGHELKLPVLLRDAIKERLLDTIGAPDRARSRELGAASYAVLYELVGHLLEAGVSVVVESNFHRGQSEQDLQPLVSRARAVLIHCVTTPQEIARRYQERFERRERHPGHHDGVALAEVLTNLQAGDFEPLDLVAPSLCVDTTEGYAPTFEEIRAFLSAVRTAEPTG